MAKAFVEACQHGTHPSYRARINIIGHSGAGKTSLTRRLLEQKFQEKEESTDGIETHRIEFDLKKGDKCSWREMELNTETLVESFKQEFQQRHTELKSGLRTTTITDTNLQANIMKPHQAPEQLVSAVVGSGDVPTAQTSDHTDSLSDLNSDEPSKFSQETLTEIEALQEGTGISAALSRMWKKVANPPHQAKAVLQLWDFGGQTEFYTTHHMFLDADAINIIVMDISKPLKEKLCREKDKAQAVAVPQTPEEFLCYWLRSIQAKAEEKKIDTNILLVLTHKDTVSGSQHSSYIQEFVQNVQQVIKANNLPQVDEKHIYIVDSNTGNQKVFNNIKVGLLDMLEKLHWKSDRPVKWLKLEPDMRVVMDARTEKPCKYLSHAEAKQLAGKLLMNEVELESFLTFLHSNGDIIWFPDSGLRHLITLDPQWLVNMFKKLITAQQFLHKQPFRDEALQLLQHGTVTFSALQKFWAGNDVDFLAKLLQNFKLILPLQALLPTEKYLVPCMLPDRQFDVHNCQLFNTMAVLYKCEHQAAFDQLFPIGTMGKLISVCSKRWQLRDEQLSHR